MSDPGSGASLLRRHLRLLQHAQADELHLDDHERLYAGLAAESAPARP